MTSIVMGNKRIGVFMKVYRNEESMHQAIQSVLSQSYQNIKFYVLVNETTKPILQKYASIDKRIEFILGGPLDNIQTYAHMMARENDYITTIDADDYYHEKYIEELLLYAENENADIVACGNYYFVSNDEIVSERKQRFLSWNTCETSKVLPYVYGHFRTIWGKLIASEIILKCNFNEVPKYDQTGAYGLDTLFMFLLFPKTKRLCVCDKTLYYYCISETGNTYKLKKGRLDADEVVFEFVENILHQIGPSGDNQRKFLLQIYGNALFDTIGLLLNIELPEQERADNLLYIFKKRLTKELFLREHKGLLNIPELGTHKNYVTKIYQQIFNWKTRNNYKEQYLQILEVIYPNLYGKITLEEFGVLLKSEQLLNAFVLEKNRQLIEMLLVIYNALNDAEQKISMSLMKKLTKNVLMKKVLQSIAFVATYSEMLKYLNSEQYTEVENLLKELFSKETMPLEAETLAELWVNLAALKENASQFILAKQLKAEIFIEKNNIEKAVEIFNELVALDVNDENMEYLKKKLAEQGEF